MNSFFKKNKMVVLNIAVLFLLILFVDFINYKLGADLNWDLLNYHFYNGFLFTHGRLITDSICTIQSYLDPLLNSFFYILIDNLSPLSVNIIIASLQAVSIFLIYLILIELLSDISYKKRIVISLLIAIAAIFGPVFWSEIGGTMEDTLTSFFVLLSLLFIIKFLKNDLVPRKRIIYIILSGFSIGLASGFKFTNMVFTFAICMSLFLIIFFFLKISIRQKIILISVFYFSALISFLIIYGPVGWLLWIKYHNPIFPYFNNIFKSEYMPYVAIKDGRWFPQNFWDYVAMPFLFCFKHKNTEFSNFGMEIPFRTLFFALVFILLPFYLVKLKSVANKKDFILHIFLLIFYIVAFVIWEIMFSYYRYLAVLEMFSPVLLILIFRSFSNIDKSNEKLLIGYAVIIFILAFYSFPHATWGRKSFSKSYFGINQEALSNYHNSLFVVGFAPMGFILPYFPEDNHFIGLPYKIPVTDKFMKEYLKSLNEFKHIYYLSKFDPLLINIKEHTNFLLEKYHLHIIYDSCKKIDTDAYPIAICEAQLVANPDLDVARELVNYKISLNSKEEVHTKPGEKYLVKYNFSNLEKFPLSSFSSSKPFNIGFHLYDEKGTMLQNDYARQQIAIDGNASIDLTTELIAPMAVGTYNIKIALVQEGVRWFENRGVTFRLVVKK